MPLSKADGEAYLLFKENMLRESQKFGPAAYEATQYLFGAIKDYLFLPYTGQIDLYAVQNRFNELINQSFSLTATNKGKR